MTNPTVLILNQLFRLNSIPSIDMLPLDRFIALTTEPFSDSCPLKIRQDLSEDTLDKIPFFRLCESLLLTLQREEKIKLTTTGALPRKFVIELYEQGFIKEYFIESGITKLSKEKDSSTIQNAKAVCDLANLTKKRNNTLTLTKSGQSLLNNRQQLLITIFTVYTTKFNWGFNDNYFNEFVPQFGFMYSLYLLQKYGDEPRPTKFYAEKYLAIAGNLRSEFLEHFESEYRPAVHGFNNCYSVRMFERFTDWFGFTSTPKVKHNKIMMTQKTEIFDKVFLWKN